MSQRRPTTKRARRPPPIFAAPRRPWTFLPTLACLTWGSTVGAQAAPDEWRSGEYYSVQAAVAAALLGGVALTGPSREPVEPGADGAWFPGDAGLRGRCSPEAAHLSDISLALALGTPVGMELGAGLNARFVNAEIVYTQALLVSRLLTSVTKVLFRRPRPHSYREAARCALQVEGSDSTRSFFSGHASGAFSAALAGSQLMNERGLDARTRAAIWGAGLTLAGATANLLVRAGRHFYSDVIVGALVGAGVGIVVPVLHGADVAPRGSDLIAAGAGLVVGVAGSQLLSFGDEAVDEQASTRFVLTPLPQVGAWGLQAAANW